MRLPRKQFLYFVLGAFFLGNALLAELVGGKLFQVALLGHTFTLSVGVLLWPIVFIVTDLVNEYFGRDGVRRLSFVTAGIIIYAFVAIWFCGLPAAASFSPIPDAAFTTVFRQSQWIIVGSIIAFLVAQLVDVTVFTKLRSATGGRMLWARATGSTLVSQLIDTFIVGFIGLHLPYLMQGPGYGVDFPTYLNGSSSGYIFKALVAVAVTPILYVGHSVIDRWLAVE